MNFNLISEQEFNANHQNLLFNESAFDKKFAYIEINNKRFFFSWSSDLVSPSVLNYNDSFIFIGIDKNYAIIGIDRKEILKAIQLDYVFYESKVIDEMLYICTELSILILSIPHFHLQKKIDLQEIFSSISLIEDKLVIEMLDGNTLVIPK